MARHALTILSTVGRFRPDGFGVSLIVTVIASTLVPCQGNTARFLTTCATVAISALFFLQGARLSRDAIVNGLTHWRLRGLTAATTFLVIPAVGPTISIVLWSLLPAQTWTGVLFLCALPSTVQSSIALTSIAKGNVSGAICSATISNLAGIILTPVLFAMMSRLHGGEIDPAAIWKIFWRLLLPFALGHVLRPWIGPWVGRHRSVLSLTDRSSVLPDAGRLNA